MIVIGIDPGTTTGLATWDTETRRFLTVASVGIVAAMMEVDHWRRMSIPLEPIDGFFVIFEDARRRKWFGDRADEKTAKHGAGVREGVGSVKRDCAIWEEFLKLHEIPFEGRYPHATKYDATKFKQLTGWEGQTNEHSRDAGMIVYGLNTPIAKAKLITWRDGATDKARSLPNRRSARPSTRRRSLAL